MGDKEDTYEKRRSDADFEVGESAPDSVGDSDGTYHDGKTQMMEEDEAADWDGGKIYD